MKKFILPILLAISSANVYSADWTYVYGQELNPDPYAETEEFVINKLKNQLFDGYNINPIIKSGKYPLVPMPYRQDLLPAKITGNNEDGTIEIPLKNAILFGTPLKKIVYNYSGHHLDYYFVFKPMSDAQFNKLKKKKFPSTYYDCQLYTSVIYKRKGEVIFASKTEETDCFPR